MALIKCPECKKKISEHAGTCPNCGYRITPLEIQKIKKSNKQSNIVFWIIAIVILILFVNMCSDDTDSSYDNSNKTINKSSRIYTKYATVNLNVRKTPNVNSDIIKVLKPNEAVKTHNKLVNNFVEIINSKGKKAGWVSGKYLRNKKLTESQLEIFQKNNTQDKKDIIGSRGDDILSLEDSLLIEKISREVDSFFTPVLSAKDSIEVEKQFAELLRYYNQLMDFKTHSEFKYYGFGVGGPYNKWLTDVEMLRKSDKLLFVSKQVTFGDLLMLGLEYTSSHGKETKYSKYMHKLIDDAKKMK